MTKDEQIAKFLTYSMEDIREENPQYIFEMWMHERRKHEAEISAKQQTINGLLDVIGQSAGKSGSQIDDLNAEIGRVMDEKDIAQAKFFTSALADAVLAGVEIEFFVFFMAAIRAGDSIADAVSHARREWDF
jgi:hypothetical protein